MPSTGKTKELSANNCKEINEALNNDCTKLPQSGVYWVQNQQVSCLFIYCAYSETRLLFCVHRFIVT